MKIVFLGTGAAEGIPSMFCRCDYCMSARKNGGKDVRTRSSLKLGEKYQIDFSPDTNYQHIREKLDLFSLEHLLITHSHDDHLAYMEVMVKECSVVNNKKPLNIYLSKSAAKWLHVALQNHNLSDNYNEVLQNEYNIVELDYFKEYAIGDLVVHTIKGSHRAYGEDEYSINYLVTMPSGKKMLYAADTGWYTDESWEYLKGQKIDTLVMECTFGGAKREKHPFGHLDVYSFIDMLDKIKDIGVIDESTDIYTTHINHKHHMLHNDLVEFFDSSDYKVVVGYDGLGFEL